MDTLPPDPYKALGVPKDADVAAIRSAHRKLVLKCHPDKVQDPELKAAKQDEFQTVQQAYELLVDEKRRVAYDEKVKLFELRKEMGRGNPTPRSNPFEYEVRTAEPRTSSSTYTRPPPNVYAQPPPRSYEDVSYEEPRGAPRKSTSYESDRKRSSVREEEKERERRRYEDEERAKQKMERKAEKSVHNDRKKNRDKERRRGTEEKTRTRVPSPYVEDDSDDAYRDPPPRSFEKKSSRHRMEEENRMREDAVRAEQAARAEQSARAQRLARERERERDRERERRTIKPAPLDPKWNEHMEYAGQYMQAANRKKAETRIEHPGMRRAETYADPSPKFNIRYATPTQQLSDDDTPRRSSARKETRRSSDTPPVRVESRSRKESIKSSRRSPSYVPDPYIVEPPSPPPPTRKPSLQTHSSAPPNLSAFRKEPTRSKTEDYPRTEKTPPLPRAQTFTASGERGRERGGQSKLRQQVYNSDSDSDVPIYSSPRHSHSPPPRKAPETTRYIYDNGRTVPVKPHRSELRSADQDAYVHRDRSESPRGTSRPSMPRQSSERSRTTPTRSQSQAYYPPDPPNAEPIILTARPKMSSREGGSHRSPRNMGSGGAYFGEVKYMAPQYGPENVIYTAHPPTSGGGGDPWRRMDPGMYGGHHREYSYPTTSRGRETIYT